MSKLSKEQKELWRRIQNILWQDWDPIGVYEPDAAWSNEYDSYVPYVYRITVEGNSQLSIANALTDIASNTIGVGAEPGNDHDLRVAGLLIAAKNTCLN